MQITRPALYCKYTKSYLQALGDTFEGHSLTPEGQYSSVGAARLKEVGFSNVSNIITWQGKREISTYNQYKQLYFFVK